MTIEQALGALVRCLRAQLKKFGRRHLRPVEAPLTPYGKAMRAARARPEVHAGKATPKTLYYAGEELTEPDYSLVRRVEAARVAREIQQARDEIRRKRAGLGEDESTQQMTAEEAMKVDESTKKGADDHDALDHTAEDEDDGDR